MNEIEHIAASFHTLKKSDTSLFEDWKRLLLNYQKKAGAVYRNFEGYTYLPVQAFKEAPICCFNPEEAERVFLSSGTSLSAKSVQQASQKGPVAPSRDLSDSGHSGRARHFVRHLEVYERSVLTEFKRVFGSGPFTILAHLPSYLPDSSLVYMADLLIRELGQPGSGFFLDDHSMLESAIEQSPKSGNSLIVLGAAFGLLDLVSVGEFALPTNSIVIETGGMKTHRREITREDLHQKLALGFGLDRSQVRSEYGMCEMLSQCYTNAKGLFETPPWVSIEVLDPNDFQTPLEFGLPGILAVFDMANVYSQSAILTQDIAIRHEKGFEVIGRMDHAAIRGCNLLLEF